MNTRAWMAVGFSLAFLAFAGCATTPFPSPARFFATEIPEAQVPAQFADQLAPRFELTQALVFRVMFHEVVALGMVAVDVPDKTFAMACLNPLGMKLFELVGTHDAVTARFVAPEMEGMGAHLIQAAGADLARAYLDESPPSGTPWRHASGRLIFSVQDAAGRTEYRYAGRDGFLAEKIRIEGRRVRWKVEFRGFRQSENGLIPTGLVLHNRDAGYRLTVREKKMETP